MKNKWYEVLGAGLLSVSAMYLCTALVVTGCSGDNSSVTGGDVAENSEVVESGDNEEVEPSDVEEISKTEKDSKAEKSSDEKESEDKESSKAEESSKTEDGESANSEKKEPAESEEESVDAQEKLTTPEGEGSAEPEEFAKTDNAESEESAEPEEPDVAKKVARHTREWYRLRDTVSYFITEESRRDADALQKLEDKGYSFITRCEWDSELEDCSMEESAFHAAYNDNEDVMHKLTDAGILWDGSEWEGWNPIENGESSVVLDTVLSAWSNDRIYVHAVYRVSYYLDSDPNTEHGFTLDVPVMYMRVD